MRIPLLCSLAARYAVAMLIGVPAEIKDNEFRVALTPAGAHDLAAAGHDGMVQTGAGIGSGTEDAAYVAAGARIVADAASAWAAEMVLKVKEPVESEYAHFRDGLLLFTYLHLAAEPELTHALLRSGVTSIAYETVQLPNRSLPLLAPMSEVAGRLGPIVGANAMLKPSGGPGLLVPGVPGTHPAKVVILGGGVAGSNAMGVAIGLGADVTVLDTNLARLREIDAIHGGRVHTIASNSYEIEQAVLGADLATRPAPPRGARAPPPATPAPASTARPSS